MRSATVKTILVLAGGSATDSVVFDTALAAARPFGGHLDFLHIDVGLVEATRHAPHIDFAMGSALHDALGRLKADGLARSAAAAAHFRDYCAREAIEMVAAPSGSRRVSAAWRQEQGDAERMSFRARHRDLVVLGRRSVANGLPSDLVELVLMGSGRPILLAPPRSRPSLTGTIMICWKEHAAAARALGAALPFLSKSKRIVVVSVEEAGNESLDAIRDVADQLAWHGIVAEVSLVPAEGRSAAEQLAIAAERYDADLMVMGSYGHGRARELIFGGCTQHFIDRAERPVLMVN